MDPKSKRIMLIGAGNAAQMILRDMTQASEVSNKVVCIIDDNPNKWHRSMAGVPIVGGRDDILSSVEKYNVDEIYLAIPSASAQQKRDILAICNETGCKLKQLPGLYQFVVGEVSVSAMKDVSVEDLLGRDPVRVNLDEVRGSLRDKTVLVTGGDMENSTLMTAAWTGIVNSDPPMTYVSIRPERYSYDIIRERGEFVINLTTRQLVRETDYAGCVSMRKEDKFKKLGLTKEAADEVAAPLIAQCPVNLECKVVEVKDLGSHSMFLANIVAVHVDEKLFDKNDRICLENADLLAYIHGGYLPLGSKKLGTFGYSVMKPKTKKKKAAESRQASLMKAKAKGNAPAKKK